MPKRLVNLAWMTTATTGTGTITVGTALAGYFSFLDAGVLTGDTVSYEIVDGNNKEIGVGTYTTAGTTLARTTITKSLIAGVAGTTALTLSGNATVFLTALAADILAVTEYDKGAYVLSTKYTQAHGLGSTAAVKLVKLFLECTTANLSYAIGDRIEIANGTSGGFVPVVTVMHNATNVIVNIGTSVVLIVSNAATPVEGSAITAASWKLIIKVYS